ncbi:chemotaxis protein, partial [Desulfovibrio sp. OttesenSCG-928-G15]|nr:chemotaxis protein [Desulfovibrio sp. OttesenSCG-928-G15]
MSQDSSLTNELEIIEFYIDETLENGENYRNYFGMNVAKVLEIIRKPPITGVPGKRHEAALGTFNLRGRVLPLVDLGLWLGKPVSEDENDKVIVTEFSTVVTAFIVSGVTRIHRMDWKQVEPPGKYLQAFSHDSITGVVRFEGRIVFLLDMEHIISSMDPSINLETRALDVTGEGGHGYHVLLADDSNSIRSIIANTLKKAQFSVTTAECGRDAWDQLKAWEQQAKETGNDITKYVNLVISDIEMPEVDGHALTRMIKADSAFNRIPVVLFSSLISKVVFEKGVKAGADDQISKPDLPGL